MCHADYKRYAGAQGVIKLLSMLMYVYLCLWYGLRQAQAHINGLNDESQSEKYHFVYVL